jgi:hypothetical protein
MSKKRSLLSRFKHDFLSGAAALSAPGSNAHLDYIKYRAAFEWRVKVQSAYRALMTSERATKPRWVTVTRYLRLNRQARVHPRTGYRWGPDKKTTFESGSPKLGF